MFPDFEKTRQSLLKAVDDRRRIRNLRASEDFQWFEATLRKLSSDQQQAIIRGDFLSNQKVEDFNKGMTWALLTIVELIDKYEDKGTKAYNRMEELNKQEQEARDE